MNELFPVSKHKGGLQSMQVLGISEDGKRLVAKAPLGFGCYEGQGSVMLIDGQPPRIQFEGAHVGWTGDAKAATDWLDGFDVPIALIYQEETVH